MPQSLIFIPDISGFTNFVKETEIQHSQHIIQELLELLIDSNEIGLELSEIEGDALLFYKSRDIPGFEALLEQSKKMFLDFHNHLVDYEHRRVCHCGACSAASQLSLKFIAHEGDVSVIKIKDRENLYGNDVILAHKLLKNDVQSDEYLLVTDAISEKSELKNIQTLDWAKLQNGQSTYENYGEIPYNFIPLNPLQAQVKEPEPLRMPEKMKVPDTVERYIDVPPDRLFQLVSDLALKESWVKGVDKLEFKKDHVNRVGDTHVCVIDQKDFEFETVSNDFGKDKLVYGERIHNFDLFKEFSTYFVIGKNGDGSDLCVQVHYLINPVLGFLLKPFIHSKIRKVLERTIEQLSAYHHELNV